VERLERFGQGMAGHFSVPADFNGMLQLDAFRELLLNWPITVLFSPQRGAPCKTADSPLGDKKKKFPSAAFIKDLFFFFLSSPNPRSSSIFFSRNSC